MGSPRALLQARKMAFEWKSGSQATNILPRYIRLIKRGCIRFIWMRQAKSILERVTGPPLPRVRCSFPINDLEEQVEQRCHLCAGFQRSGSYR